MSFFSIIEVCTYGLVKSMVLSFFSNSTVQHLRADYLSSGTLFQNCLFSSCACNRALTLLFVPLDFRGLVNFASLHFILIIDPCLTFTVSFFCFSVCTREH
jgi:hypothetical protein